MLAAKFIAGTGTELVFLFTEENILWSSFYNNGNTKSMNSNFIKIL